jgi:hypothetical protein
MEVEHGENPARAVHEGISDGSGQADSGEQVTAA